MTTTTSTVVKNPLLRAALGYAERGWRVFPITPGTKRPATPRHRATDCDHTDHYCRNGHTGWEQRATTNPDRITRAWTTAPHYGIGIACGPSGLIVLDLDLVKPGAQPPPKWAHHATHTTGQDTLNALTATNPNHTLPTTYTVTTPTGGQHLYYLHPPPPTRLGNTTNGLGWLIDTRAHGGYVIAPPTPGYTLTHPHTPTPLPTWITHTLTPTHHTPTRPEPSRTERYLTAALTAETHKVATAPPGTRNHTLFCAALALGQLIATGALNPHHTRQALHTANTTNPNPLPTHEADTTITSGFTTGTHNPRTPPTNQRH